MIWYIDFDDNPNRIELKKIIVCVAYIHLNYKWILIKLISSKLIVSIGVTGVEWWWLLFLGGDFLVSSQQAAFSFIISHTFWFPQQIIAITIDNKKAQRSDEETLQWILLKMREISRNLNSIDSSIDFNHKINEIENFMSKIKRSGDFVCEREKKRQEPKQDRLK